MNREQAKALLPFIQAFSEGKTIQWLTGSGEWYDVVGNDTIDFEYLADRKTKYRIKPEFKDGDIFLHRALRIQRIFAHHRMMRMKQTEKSAKSDDKKVINKNIEYAKDYFQRQVRTD